MAELPPLPDIFGNYTIRGIAEVLPPDAVDWLPSAPGWRYLALVLALAGLWRGWLAWKKWLKNRYRRAALRQLDQLVESPPGPGLLQPLSRLLKTTALQAYPRAQVANLSGEAWLRWLNENGGGATFSGDSAELLARGVYHRDGDRFGNGELGQLAQDLGRWISSHPGASDV